MVFDNGKINTSQLYRLIVTGVSGIGCLLTTDISVAFGGAKGLICLLMAAVLSGLYAELILWLCKKTGWQYRVWAQKHLYKPLRVVIVGLAVFADGCFTGIASSYKE